MADYFAKVKIACSDFVRSRGTIDCSDLMNAIDQVGGGLDGGLALSESILGRVYMLVSDSSSGSESEEVTGPYSGTVDFVSDGEAHDPSRECRVVIGNQDGRMEDSSESTDHTPSNRGIVHPLWGTLF